MKDSRVGVALRDSRTKHIGQGADIREQNGKLIDFSARECYQIIECG